LRFSLASVSHYLSFFLSSVSYYFLAFAFCSIPPKDLVGSLFCIDRYVPSLRVFMVSRPTLNARGFVRYSLTLQSLMSPPCLKITNTITQNHRWQRNFQKILYRHVYGYIS